MQNEDPDRFSQIPLSVAIGMDTLNEAAGIMRVRYSEKLVGDPDTGVVHGGVITALLDSVSGRAARNAIDLEALTSIATLDLRIDYMRPAAPNKDLLARADCYKTTRNVAFVRAWAYQDDEENLVATSVGTFMLGTRATPL